MTDLFQFKGEKRLTMCGRSSDQELEPSLRQGIRLCRRGELRSSAPTHSDPHCVHLEAHYMSDCGQDMGRGSIGYGQAHKQLFST